MTLCKCAQPKQLFPVWKMKRFVCAKPAKSLPLLLPSGPPPPPGKASDPAQTFSHQFSSFVTSIAPGNNIALALGRCASLSQASLRCLSGWVLPIIPDLGQIWLLAELCRLPGGSAGSFSLAHSLLSPQLSPFCFERPFIPPLLS